jgi:hypothetical protein
LKTHPVKGAQGYQCLIVDGTGARFQEHGGQAGLRWVNTYQGEIRLVLAGKSPSGPFKVVGRWANESWQAIAREVYRRIDPRDIQVLITDGEVGIEEAFIRPWMRHQRCTTHALRDFSYLMYSDGALKAVQGPYQKMMNEIPVFQYARKDVMEYLKSSDHGEIEQAVKMSRKSLVDLKESLERKGYWRTAKYLSNLTEPVLTFLKEWLDGGDVIPMTSNIVENRFSLVKNRIRSIGRRWSDEGLLRWLDLAVHKLFPGYDWEQLWKKIMPAGNVSCQVVGAC